RKSQVAINRNIIVEEFANVDRHTLNTRGANLDRVQEAIDNFKLPTATNRARQAAFCHRLQAQFFGSLIGDNRHTRTGVEHETKRCPVSVYANLNDGAIVSRFEGDGRTVLAARNVERSLVAEITQEVD